MFVGAKERSSLEMHVLLFSHLSLSLSLHSSKVAYLATAGIDVFNGPHTLSGKGALLCISNEISHITFAYRMPNYVWPCLIARCNVIIRWDIYV